MGSLGAYISILLADATFTEIAILVLVLIFAMVIYLKLADRIKRSNNTQHVETVPEDMTRQTENNSAKVTRLKAELSKLKHHQ